MAGEVDPQSDVSLMGGRARTLHLKTLRKQWQIITLQIVSTVALVWMYLEVVSTYVVNSIDHTMLFESLEREFGDLPIGDWIIGSGRTGLARFYVPIVLGLGLGGSMALMAFQSPRVQQRIKLGFIITLMVILVGQLTLTWIPSMLLSWDLRAPTDSELKTLEWPLLMILSLVILFIYLLPVIMGTRGIWGLSRRSIGWAIGFTLLFLGIHAILTFPLIKTQLGTWGSNLISLESRVSDPTIGILGFELVTREQLSLILIAVLIMVFQESGFGVIRYLEYAYRLPESCKRDPEYVRQMDNVLNGHLRHTAGFLTITGLVTMVALGFHSVLLEVVGASTGSQWAAQVSESIELSLTYGLVISALLFLSLVAVLRFFVPWQRVWGLIESMTSNTPEPTKEKEY